MGKHPEYHKLSRMELRNINTEPGTIWAINVAKLPDRQGNLQIYYGFHIKNRHKELIKDALAEGKSIPAKVLNDYPELEFEGCINGKKFDIAKRRCI